MRAGSMGVDSFRQDVRAWLEANVPRHRDSWSDALVEARWIGASWPVEYGGRGLSVAELVVLHEEFTDAGVPLHHDPVGELMVGPTILEWGSERQKRELLPAILRAELR